jgi:succinate-semialdehyde dehydrogenase/glutarate-semialdehyde dehydrogenase
MKFQTINPATEEIIAEYVLMSNEEVFKITDLCWNRFLEWREVTLTERTKFIVKLAEVLRNNKREYAEIITTEMGKPITESIAEIEKCAWTAEVYAEHAVSWLSDEEVEADGKFHKVIYQPLGIILSIMPWNFPFWQVLRFAIPTVLAGNVSILKHSNAVPQCALSIEAAFKLANFPENVFRTILVSHDTISELMSSEQIRGVSFTGSTSAGARIAENAARNLKKFVLELGGSDPFIVLADADVDLAATSAVKGRTINAGQSCIAAKRFIVEASVAEQFSQKFATMMSQLKVGDPLDEKTEIGPLVNAKALSKIEQQVSDAQTKGAKVLAGGSREPGKGYYYKPTILAQTTPEMQVTSDEVFGPVAPIIVVKDESEAIAVANSTEFGLGGSIWTKNIEHGEELARQVESGSVFVNSITKSDPRMPFGGVKKSGIGRELSKFGLKEFVNVKGINVYEYN